MIHNPQRGTPCPLGAGAAAQTQGEGSHMMSLTQDHSNSDENQVFPTGRARHSWSKICLNETQNYQRCEQTPVKNKLCIFAPCVDIFNCISRHHDDATVHERERAHSNRDCGEDVSEASPLAQLSIIPTGQQTYQCDDYEKAFTDGHGLQVHQQVHLGKRSLTYSTHEKEPSYNSPCII